MAVIIARYDGSTPDAVKLSYFHWQDWFPLSKIALYPKKPTRRQQVAVTIPEWLLKSRGIRVKGKPLTEQQAKGKVDATNNWRFRLHEVPAMPEISADT